MHRSIRPVRPSAGRRRAVGAAAVVALLLAGCGGDDDAAADEVSVAAVAVEPADWLTEICATVETLNDRTRAVLSPEGLEDLDPTTVDGRQQIVDILDGALADAVAALEQADRDVADLGVPSGGGGVELVEQVRVGIADLRARHAQARESVGRLDADDDTEAFTVAVNEALTRLDRPTEAFAEVITRVETDPAYGPTRYQDERCRNL